MAIVDYSLFRVKFVLPRQKSWLHYPTTPAEIFVTSLQEKPPVEVRQGYRWHIGNFKRFSKIAGYFAIGRTNKATIGKYDLFTGDFGEEEVDASPYTHCVYDAKLGFVGIARNGILSANVNGIAKRLQEVLSRSTPVSENEIRVEIAPIPNPETFLREIASAAAVKQYSATFHGPNPFDADEHFQKPLSSLLAYVEGEQGRTQLNGEDLNRRVLEDITRSTAATGNEATARIQRKPRDKTVTIRMSGGTVGTSYPENEHDPKQVLDDLRSLYRGVRS